MLDLLAYKRTNMPVTNLLPNSDFSQGTKSWYSYRGYLKSTDNNSVTLSYEDTAYPYMYQRVKVNEGDDLYMSAKVKALIDGINTIKIYHSFNGKKIDINKDVKSGEIYRLSGVSKNAPRTNPDFAIAFTDNDYSEDGIEVFNALVINLTNIFGKGNEPTKEQMDRLMEQFPDKWFSGTQNIFNAEHFMKMYFNKMQELENAITSLGGNI